MGNLAFNGRYAQECRLIIAHESVKEVGGTNTKNISKIFQNSDKIYTRFSNALRPNSEGGISGNHSIKGGIQMKKCLALFCLFLALCLALPAMGLAETQEEWNLSCRYKTRVSSRVYSTNGWHTREGNEPNYVTTIPANTYVKKWGGTSPWQRIRWMENGVEKNGWVWEDEIIRCASEVSLGEGQGSRPVSELDPQHDELVKSGVVLEVAPSVMEERPEDFANVTYQMPDFYMDQAIQQATTEQEKWNLSCTKKTTSAMTVYKTDVDGDEVLMTIPAGTYVKIEGTALTWQTIQFMIDGVKYLGRTAIGGLADATTQVNGKFGMTDSVHELDPRYSAIVSGELTSDDIPSTMKKSTTVALEELGTVTSKVTSEGKTIEVKTSDLTFSEDVPEDKRVAVVYAPRTGKASLRAKASSNASVIKQCKAGTIVAVLKTGNTFTQINYNGTVGYILTSCLQFHSPDAEAEGGALLSYNGKTNGSTTVNVRNQPSKDSAKVATWNTGTAVVILSHKDGWYEIEAKGIHGYVMDQYVTVK